MKRMLFNATQAEELRVAIVDGQKLIDLDIESAAKEQRKSNIYKGIITRVEPSLEAAFVDYGTERHGFLPFKEISRSYFNKQAGDISRAHIQDVIKEGQELIVQVEKDERGNKGAALTTFISLAGRYLVLMPNNPRGGGVSRRVEGEERDELRDTMAQLEVPQGMSIIARTAGIGRSAEELQWDLNYLMQLWRAIEGAAQLQGGAYLIYQEGSLVIRAIRDYFQPDIGEILIDTDEIYEQARQFMGHVMPANVNKVKMYKDDVPLFSRFQIEHQIETAYARQVPLPSGGAIVIDHTEALVSVDVNSARATRGTDIEQTAFNTNLEAAEEVARQLRLRDLGGLVVIDFIDMESQKHQREVENKLRDSLHFDRARVQMGKISRFGLLELSRQRLQPSLGETAHISCPRCNGTGHIRGTESSALHILRIIQEEAMKENTGAVHAQVPVDVATFLLNEKRSDILTTETRFHVGVMLIPNMHMETPHYNIVRLRQDELLEANLPSYQLVENPSEIEITEAVAQEAKAPRQEAVVRGITPTQPAPLPTEKKSNWMGGVKEWLQGLFAEKKEVEKPKPRPQGNRRRRDRSGEKREEGRGPKQQRPVQEPRQPRPEKAPALAAATEKTGEAEVQEPREGRKRSRRGRGRGGDRGERREERQVQEGASSAVPETAEAAPREPKEPREPRQRREPREPREPREQREPREPREAKEPRPPRQEREEAVSSEPVAAESILETAPAPMPVAVEPPVDAAPIPAPVEDIRPVVVESVLQVAAVAEPAPAEPEAMIPEPVTLSKPEPLAVPVQMELVEPKSDLVQIETRAHTESVVADAPLQAESSREPRRRPSIETSETGSAELVQIETKADNVVVNSPSLEETTENRPRSRQTFTPPTVESQPLVQVETRK